MSEPPGQLRTEVPPAGKGSRAQIVISSGREVEQGARSMLLLAEGLFRLDVVPHDDTVQTILRNLSAEPQAEVRYQPVGGESRVAAGSALTLPATTRFGGEVVLIDGDGGERPVAKLLVSSVCNLERGITTFTAQATLTPSADFGGP
jgi:hypothetical protein